MERWQDVYRNSKLHMTPREIPYAQVMYLKKQGLSVDKIIKRISSVHPNTIQAYYLGRLKPLKTNHVQLTQGLVEYLDGMMLGDGSVQGARLQGVKCGKVISSHYTQGFAERYGEWAYMIGNDLEDYDMETRIRKGWSTKNDKRYPMYELCTLSYYELTDYRNRWYANGRGSKRLPDDVKVISPRTMLNWYLGDGSLYTRYRAPRLCFGTQGFTLEEVKRLEAIIQKMGLMTHHYSNNGKNYEIALVRKRDIIKLLEYMDCVPRPRCFDYKFNYEPMLVKT